MHDIDRTIFETSEFHELSSEGAHSETAEFHEVLEQMLGGETGGAGYETEMHEATEVELASELMEVTSEAELDRFLGNLLSKVTSAGSSFVRSDTGRALGGILKNAAKQALPVVGRAVGSWVTPGGG